MRYVPDRAELPVQNIRPGRARRDDGRRDEGSGVSVAERSKSRVLEVESSRGIARF